MGAQLSDIDKGKILALLGKNQSIRQISAELNIPKTTVGSFIKKYKETRSTKREIRSGRKPILTATEEEKISRFVIKNPKLSAHEIKEQMQKLFKKKVARRTVGDILDRNSIKCYIARKKPLISDKNKVSRFNLSKHFLGFSEEKWKSIIFFG
ncbi:hypothetical protein ENBRE01_2631 [Enteropsectra breve]|nr:hypothetical protein ENBRE01_2631 [Enteropsectra breve]